MINKYKVPFCCSERTKIVYNTNAIYFNLKNNSILDNKLKINSKNFYKLLVNKNGHLKNYYHPFNDPVSFVKFKMDRDKEV